MFSRKSQKVHKFYEHSPARRRSTAAPEQQNALKIIRIESENHTYNKIKLEMA
jgi:hypothetical protein